ncbi:segregation/condensation protein A [Thermoleophilum album]|uniref:segregation and condensation protein A n=1 Tax=Thermoleophilum album TaxID=29539 RepID=UPI00199E9EF5|nr:segregation/condensation protein A [Thermoleophilum album]WDT94381.1 segregation/condensation protein A [Thermoleophilum album]
MHLAALDLELDAFEGPFDLLLALVLSEEVDLRDVELAAVVVAYVDHLERQRRLDLEAITEFLVLIAALLEIKSRLLLPQDESDDADELGPQEAAEELLARMVEYARFRKAGAWLRERLAAESAYRFRQVPLPASLRQVALETARPVYDPERLARAIGDLLRTPPPIDTSHVRRPVVPLSDRVRHLRALLSARATFSFDDAVRGADRLTEAVTLLALLELYKAGELDWEQSEPFGPITVRRAGQRQPPGSSAVAPIATSAVGEAKA